MSQIIFPFLIFDRSSFPQCYNFCEALRYTIGSGSLHVTASPPGHLDRIAHHHSLAVSGITDS
jgi:hypothetical protein